MLVDGVVVSLPGILLLGAVVGTLAGMFGVGGNFLLTPLLSALFGVPLTVATGTGLCQMVGTSLTSLLRHRRLGNGEPRFDLLMLAGSIVGVDAGTRTLVGLVGVGGMTAHFVVGGVYVVVLLSTAILFVAQASGYRGSAPLARLRIGPRMTLRGAGAVSAVVIAYVGFALGFLSGMLGIGGGIMLLPVLVYGFGFPIRQATGTGIVVILCSASYGTFVQALRGNVDLGLALALMASATPAAQLGVTLTRRLEAGRLRRIFAAVLVVTAAIVVWGVARKVL